MRVLLGIAMVVVRVYDIVGVADIERQKALDVAQELLAETNTHVIFRMCTGDEAATAACEKPLGPGERMLRIMNAPSPPRAGTEGSLGNAAVDDRNIGVLATAYPDRIAKKVRDPEQRTLLLGRTIAHEIGHLLLAANGHSKSGLMREFWTDQELKRNEATDWAFSAEDRSRIMANLLCAGPCSNTTAPGATTDPARTLRNVWPALSAWTR